MDGSWLGGERIGSASRCSFLSYFSGLINQHGLPWTCANLADVGLSWPIAKAGAFLKARDMWAIAQATLVPLYWHGGIQVELGNHSWDE